MDLRRLSQPRTAAPKHQLQVEILRNAKKNMCTEMRASVVILLMTTIQSSTVLIAFKTDMTANTSVIIIITRNTTTRVTPVQSSSYKEISQTGLSIWKPLSGPGDISRCLSQKCYNPYRRSTQKGLLLPERPHWDDNNMYRVLEAGSLWN